jgi:glycosyltransferase involved in cell wall biosynthesis
VRRRFRPRSAAATVLRAVDLRALRLPDLVVCGTDAEARYLAGLGATNVASVFLGADEDLYSHRWAPAYPFTAVHFVDPSAAVVAEAAALTDVPVSIVGPEEIPFGDLGIAVAHAGIVVAGLHESRAIAPPVFAALAAGAPVITADTHAARELLRDGDSALLVPPGDAPALAQAIERLASEDDLRRPIAERGHAVFEEHASRHVLGERWLGLLEQLV